MQKCENNNKISIRLAQPKSILVYEKVLFEVSTRIKGLDQGDVYIFVLQGVTIKGGNLMNFIRIDSMAVTDSDVDVKGWLVMMELGGFGSGLF